MSEPQSKRRFGSMGRVLALVLLLAGHGFAQTSPAGASAPSPMTGQGTVIDQVIAVVNGDLVLESDMEEERRFEAFQPFRDQTQAFSRERTVERLVDRTLILEQEKLQPQPPITDAEVTAQFTTLRKDIPACKEYECETDAGWAKFVAAQGFTMAELQNRWRERMEVLRFIEQRFKMGIRISPTEIKGYYDKTLLPAYARRKATPPRLDTISDRIQEILLQQQVGALLEDWLKSLKAQGTVHLMTPGEVTP